MFDIVVVGGGIVGTATAYRLKRIYPDSRIILIEKEKELAFHQTGHNSGVIHSGIYYRPGSLKAKTAVYGSYLMKEFCKKYGIPFEVTGKLIVATREKEIFFLKKIYKRGIKNGVFGLRILSKEEIEEMEPLVKGLKAIYVPGTGIVDFKKVTEKLGELFKKEGGEIILSNRLENVEYHNNYLVLITQKEEIKTRYLITCAGLHADRIARLGGGKPGVRIIPFRGEYYKIKRKDIVKRLIYPVPDPRYPFLGVHLTKKLDGEIEAGPNAFFAFAREGYRRSEINLRDIFESLTYAGFIKLSFKHWSTGVKELLKTFSKRIFLNELKKIIPDIKEEEILKGGSGIRAQAVSPDGKLVDDFFLIVRPRIIHVCNAPSPAATASLAIAEEISKMLEKNFDLKPKFIIKKIWF